MPVRLLSSGRLAAIVVLILGSARSGFSQERGANALGETILGLGVNTRVLVVGAHPDDEDTFLIAWLSRGRHVSTAYLSLTRGDGGQNLIGNELGEALGVLRTEELLAARRIDGGEQYFTRAYDFGYSKTVEDTYRHWVKDSILTDVVRVVRTFRPHVIVAVFSGTPRDGHGHHQVSGVLAREAYDAAGDTSRFPGSPWTPLKFYRAARFNAANATLSFDAGEYSPLLGRSYAEIAAESRSQHKSQGFGSALRRGAVLDYLRREASRVNEETPPDQERSIFDGIDTTWGRFSEVAAAGRPRAALDSLPAALQAAKSAFDPLSPERLIAPLGRVRRLLLELSQVDFRASPDLDASLSTTFARVDRALALASAVEAEAIAPRELSPDGEVTLALTVHNRGRVAVTPLNQRAVEPGTSRTDSLKTSISMKAGVWWLRWPRAGAMFTHPGSMVSEADVGRSDIGLTVFPSGTPNYAIGEPLPFNLNVPIQHREVDPVGGEIRRGVLVAEPVTVTLDRRIQYAPANTSLERDVVVRVQSHDVRPRDVRVTLELPRGLTLDSAWRTIRLEQSGSAASVTFRVRGRLTAGSHGLTAVAESDGRRFTAGYQTVEYDHIRRRRIELPSSATMSAVDVRLPPALRVAYVRGVGDNVAPMLEQLGIPVTMITPAELLSGEANLPAYSTVVIGSRAYESSPELAQANERLFDFARRGGTVVVQYGQNEMTRPGMLPYSINLGRPAPRVTEEDAPVAIIDPDARELRAPNRIGPGDFTGWVQERGLYMPRTFDERWRPLLETNDTGEQPIRGGILVAPVGEGVYVYTTLSFFRQLPAGVPGAARLFVNLLSAGAAPAGSQP